jgi:hypothetical protein
MLVMEAVGAVGMGRDGPRAQNLREEELVQVQLHCSDCI